MSRCAEIRKKWPPPPCNWSLTGRVWNGAETPPTATVCAAFLMSVLDAVRLPSLIDDSTGTDCVSRLRYTSFSVRRIYSHGDSGRSSMGS